MYICQVKKKKKKKKGKLEWNRTWVDSNTSFRSRALRVMSPARFRCAMLLDCWSQLSQNFNSSCLRNFFF